MTAQPNTLFLRLEGPLQAWGDTSKFVIRRTMDAPTKSGVLGLICCALGISRADASTHLPTLAQLRLGVRVDRAPVTWWDYHTVAAGYGILSAEGKVKVTQSTKEPETLITRREYLADASFLAALQGDPATLQDIAAALLRPRWTLYLGRKSCPPTAPIFAGQGHFNSLTDALKSIPWSPRSSRDPVDPRRPSFIEWTPTADQPNAPPDAEVWYDVPLNFRHPAHQARFVCRTTIEAPAGPPLWDPPKPPGRRRADYTNSAYREQRKQRLHQDHHLCVFCKSPATTVQHITYRRAGGHESLDDLRALCRLCHDAVTMIEYGLNMGLDRIDPVEPRWRDQIRNKRLDIIQYRSLETRNRALRGESVDEI
ncbi:MAG: type I-E CRISPR-associated protein Cas5/CasD [Bryobacteraceae bacterium]|nr:type I-E CRISPR-associated protein Cas5/CasD [Bryobacteraceae bacterium]